MRVKLRTEIMGRDHVLKKNGEERCKVDDRQLFESNVGVDW